jgi:hypothetical protein
MTATNPPDRTAIDTVLIKLNLGCQYMEINHPSKADVKKASEAAKDAADILKACLVLLDHDIYVVQEAPPAPGVPLFKDSGEPSRGAEVPAPEPTPEPAKVLPTLGIIDVEVVRKFKVGDRVKEVLCQEDLDAGEKPRTGVIDEDDGSTEDNAPYFVTLDGDGYSSWFDAAELEMVEAGPELTADQKTLAEPFPKGTKAEQKAVFGQRLTTLKDIFCQRLDLAGSTATLDSQLKEFRPHRNAWAAAWKADAKATWPKLLAAIVEANTLANKFTSWAPEVAA